MKSDLPYLGHIADSIATIESYVAGGRDAFMTQRLVQDAVVRNFEIIGEAASLPSLKREVACLLRILDQEPTKRSSCP